MSESRSSYRLLYLHQIAFSLNIASAFAYAALIYVSRSQAFGNPHNDAAYYFLRAAFRIKSRDRAGVGKWALATAGVAIAILCFAWVPTKGKTLALAKDLGSVTVQLSRGPCYGSCPSYVITIHGNGLIEYIGDRHVRIQGSQTGTVNREQLIRVLENLDRAHFWTLDDRAFTWCFDSDSVSVSVSIDGETKRVLSDGGCTGPKCGLQARFVQSAAGIDSIVGSDKLVSCNGPCWK